MLYCYKTFSLVIVDKQQEPETAMAVCVSMLRSDHNVSFGYHQCIYPPPLFLLCLNAAELEQSTGKRAQPG